MKTEFTDNYKDRKRCFECVHYFFNNGEKDIDGCRAFPNGIPDNAQGGYNHNEIIENQKGDFVYRKAKYDELSPFARYLYKLKKSK